MKRAWVPTAGCTTGPLTKANALAQTTCPQLIFWTQLFMEAQCYKIKHNKSTILLSENGKNSSTERAHALNICYFLWQTKLKKEMWKSKIVPPTRWLPTAIPSHSRADHSPSCDGNCSNMTSFRSQSKAAYGRSVGQSDHSLQSHKLHSCKWSNWWHHQVLHQHCDFHPLQVDNTLQQSSLFL